MSPIRLYAGRRLPFALTWGVVRPASIRAKPVLGLVAGFIALWGNLYGSATAAAAASTRPPSLLATASSPMVTTTNHPCGSVVKAPTYKHIVWIFFENHSYDTIIGTSDAAYFNFLAAKCGLATNYHNVTHPSLPNYISATSGLGLATLNRFTGDCDPTGTCTTNTKSIFAQGESWKAYEDSMPSNCYMSDAGNYAVRHNPPTYYTTLRGCASHDVPYAKLPADLANNSLPAFSFITPNLIHDMHNGTVADGNQWLATNLPALLASPEYTRHTMAIFITWDEGEGGSSDNCAANTTDVGCHVAALVISPSTPAGARSARLFNHYSLLATAEQLLGLPKLGRAASNSSMVSAFNL
jgi:phospholipase C